MLGYPTIFLSSNTHSDLQDPSSSEISNMVQSGSSTIISL